MKLLLLHMVSLGAWAFVLAALIKTLLLQVGFSEGQSLFLRRLMVASAAIGAAIWINSVWTLIYL